MNSKRATKNVIRSIESMPILISIMFLLTNYKPFLFSANNLKFIVIGSALSLIIMQIIALIKRGKFFPLTWFETLQLATMAGLIYISGEKSNHQAMIIPILTLPLIAITRILSLFNIIKVREW